jgi:hypothetical protein
MQELRLVAVSEDGSYAILEVPGRSGRFLLPIDDRLRTVAKGQFSRLAQYEIEVENPLRPKEIQDRIRAGETAEEIADAAGIPPDRVRRFEGPVLAERQYRAQEAQRATIRGYGESGPGPRLGDIVASRLSGVGASADTVEWDSRKRPDGNWQVQIQFTVGGRAGFAEWIYDPRRRHVIPDDEQAMRLSLPADEWAAVADRTPATATVTPIGSRQHGTYAGPARDFGPARDSGPARDYGSARDFGAARDLGQARDFERRSAPTAAKSRDAGSPADRSEAADTASPARQPEVPAANAAAVNAPTQPAAKPAKKSGRARRASVPSWDEIMFGTSRPSD